MKKALIASLCIALAVLLASCSFGAPAIYPNSEKYTAGNASFTEKIEKIDVDWSNGELIIIQADTDKVTLEEECTQSLSDEEKVHWMLDGTTLRVKFCKSGTMINPTAEKKLTVTVPKDPSLLSLDASCASASLSAALSGADEINLSSASGEITAKLGGTDTVNMSSASGKIMTELSDTAAVSISSSSGAMSVVASQADSLSLSSASGEIELNMAGEVSSLEIDSASGDVTVNGEAAKKAVLESSSGKISASFEKTPDTLEIGTSSGDVSLTLPEDASFKAEIDTASGAFECEFPTVRKGDTYICGDGKSEISFDTASGDINIYKAD